MNIVKQAGVESGMEKAALDASTVERVRQRRVADFKAKIDEHESFSKNFPKAKNMQRLLNRERTEAGKKLHMHNLRSKSWADHKAGKPQDPDTQRALKTLGRNNRK